MKIVFSLLTIFNNFSDFLTLLVTKKLMTSHITDNVSIFSLSLYWVWNNKLSAKTFWKDLTHMCTKRSSKDEFLMTLMKLRSSFLFTDISQHFGIYLVVCTLRTFIHGNRWLKIICDLKTINLHTRYGNDISNQHSWRRGVVIITTAQLHFCAGSNPARGVSEIRDGEDQWSRLEIRLNAFRQWTIPQKQFIIFITTPNSKFPNLIRERSLRNIHRNQRTTWSDYKHHNTVEILVWVFPIQQ